MNLEDQDSDISIDNNSYPNTMFFPKSYYYFKLGILFYFLCKLKNINSKDDQFNLFNRIYEFKQSKDIFNKIYKNIFEDKNCLISTYFMQIPSTFVPIPGQFIYYRPYVTFYKNKKSSNINISEKFSIERVMQNYLTNRITINDFRKNKWLDRYLQDQHMFPKTQSIFIPIDNNSKNYFNNLTNEFNDIIYYMIYNNDCYIAKNNGNNIFNLLFKKEGKYIPINRDIDIDFNKIDYLSAMIPISKNDLINAFELDTLPKNSLLYHNRSDDLTEGVLRKFYGLYPTLNMINPFGLFNDADYHCFIYKLKENLEVINLNKDVFYHDLFNEKDKKETFIFKDTRDNKKIIESKLFNCIGDNLENRKQCNFNIIKDYGDLTTFTKNKGKRMLTLLISKSTLYWLDVENYYYMDFIGHYNIDAFIYHYGIYKNKFMDVELGMINNREKYIEYIKVHKGECNNKSSDLV